MYCTRKPHNREFEFPAHSLFDPCSESSQKLSFTRQRPLQQGLTSQELQLKAQYSLYFSLLAGNFGPEKSSRETASTAIQSALVMLYITFRLKYRFSPAKLGDLHFLKANLSL